MTAGQDLYNEAKKVIPGGTQLLSKRPEMWLPDQWPAYYSKAKGCEVWDMDGNHYYDMSIMGVGANALGYAFDEVDDAAKQAIDNGGMCTLNAPEEVYLAEKLLELHPWARLAVKLWRWQLELPAHILRRTLFWYVAIMDGMIGIYLQIWLKGIHWLMFIYRAWLL